MKMDMKRLMFVIALSLVGATTWIMYRLIYPCIRFENKLFAPLPEPRGIINAINNNDINPTVTLKTVDLKMSSMKHRYDEVVYGLQEKIIRRTNMVNLIPSSVQKQNGLSKSPPFTDVPHRQCKLIPSAPAGYSWPEEAAIYEPKLTNILDVADTAKSKVWVDGSKTVNLGDSFRVYIRLYDGRGQPRSLGGDLIRVWMREKSKHASTTGDVVDFNNGTFMATVTAYWVGKPEVVVAIAEHREVINAVLRRRYICPPVVHIFAVYEHLIDKSITEKVPCNTIPDIPGYDVVCNLTNENYGLPWYCGKPRSQRLMCLDWNKVSFDRQHQHYPEKEKELFTSAENEFLFSKSQITIFPEKIQFTVLKGTSNAVKLQDNVRCNKLSQKSTRNLQRPTGYMYNSKWINPHCLGPQNNKYLPNCLQNIQLTLVGDSTVRQKVLNIEKRVKCTWITDQFDMNKHHPAKCVNANMNYSLQYHMHSLPFNTRMAPRQYFRPFRVILDEIQNNQKAVVLLKIDTHFRAFHSSVVFAAFKEMKKAILRFLKRNIDSHVVIEGPNSFNSFATGKVKDTLWKSEIYTEMYASFISQIFRDMPDNVMYLNPLDMTIATEQWHVHAEDYIITELVDQVFHRVCNY